ncbi:MAG TPA: hypothetical protein PKY12_01190 [Catalimonadaceae bacterium]|nr:hypothetical protein [Catalimonadaceae bacterium]
MQNEQYLRWLKGNKQPASVESAVAGVRTSPETDAAVNTGIDAISLAVPGMAPIKQAAGVASGLVRQEDEYGVADSDAQAGIGAVLNPVPQLSDAIGSLSTGNTEGFVKNLLLVPGAMETNKKQRNARDSAQAKFMAYKRSQY